MRLLPLICFLVLAGCAAPQKRPDAVTEFLQVEKTRPGANLSGQRERKAVARFEKFLSHMTEESVREGTRKVYAPDAWLNDTLKTVRGSTAIEEYFLGSAQNTEEITVRFLDVARSGNDFYFRWVMDVRFRKFAKGKTIRTIGITQVRFDESGRVILHQDYWDSSAGLFEHVPVIGAGIGWIKSQL